MGRKREARIARAHEAQLKNEEKKARLLERVEQELPPKRTVRLGVDPGSIFHMQMAWHCDAADRLESWSWGQERNWDDATHKGDIEPKLDEFAKLTWAEIDKFVTNSGHKAHHGMAIDEIDKEPQLRLQEIAINHGDDIFRFRLGFNKRLWGFRALNVFEVLWWDPHHKIYSLDPE